MSNCSLNALKPRFHSLWDRCSRPANRIGPAIVWSELVQSYEEPWRHYHTAGHLCHCLQQLDLAAALMDDSAAVEIALWFHDIILLPDAADNEEKSAARFRHNAGDSFPPAFVERVSNMILATRHRDLPLEHDTRYLCDIDLSSLGSPWEEFLSDSTAVRAEQPGTADAPFLAAKVGFFNALLERPAIFLTDFFQARYEQSARENIRQYIAQLKV